MKDFTDFCCVQLVLVICDRFLNKLTCYVKKVKQNNAFIKEKKRGNETRKKCVKGNYNPLYLALKSVKKCLEGFVILIKIKKKLNDRIMIVM